MRIVYFPKWDRLIKRWRVFYWRVFYQNGEGIEIFPAIPTDYTYFYEFQAWSKCNELQQESDKLT